MVSYGGGFFFFRSEHPNAHAVTRHVHAWKKKKKKRKRVPWKKSCFGGFLFSFVVVRALLSPFLFETAGDVKRGRGGVFYRAYRKG